VTPAFSAFNGLLPLRDLRLAANFAIPSAMAPSPTVLVFDSGLGGLTVLREIVKARPDARCVYAADDAYFP
jgi:glutamate racemase